MENRKNNNNRKSRRRKFRKGSQIAKTESYAPGQVVKHITQAFRPIPDVARVRLEYTSTRQLAGIPSFQGLTFGCFSPGSFLPRYWTQYFALYRYAFIHQIRVHVQAANIGTNPFTIALGESNSTDSPLATMKILAEKPRTIWRQCIVGGNSTTVSLDRTVTGESVLGKSVRGDQAFYCQIGTFPTLPYLPQLIVGWEPTILAAPFDAVVTTKYYLDVEFFTLNPQV